MTRAGEGRIMHAKEKGRREKEDAIKDKAQGTEGR